MKKLISNHNKDLCISLSIALIGVLGCMIDYYNGEQDVFPRIPIFSFLDEKIQKNEPDMPATYRIYDRYISMSSVWFLFIIFGIFLFYVELFGYKSPILIYGIPILLICYIKIEMTKAKIQLYKYLIR